MTHPRKSVPSTSENMSLFYVTSLQDTHSHTVTRQPSNSALHIVSHRCVLTMFTAFLRVAVATSTLLAMVQSQAPNGATGPWDAVNDTFLCTYDPFGQRATLPVSERLAFCTHTSHQTSLHSRAHAHTHSTHTRFSWHHVYLIATSSAVRGTPLYRYPHTT